MSYLLRCTLTGTNSVLAQKIIRHLYQHSRESILSAKKLFLTTNNNVVNVISNRKYTATTSVIKQDDKKVCYHVFLIRLFIIYY